MSLPVGKELISLDDKEKKEKVLPYDLISIDNNFNDLDNTIKGDLNGSLKVKLVVKTPMVAVNESPDIKNVSNRGERIPGSSIRGALRSAMEITWNGRVTVLDIDEDKNKDENKENLNEKYIDKNWLLKNSTLKKHDRVAHIMGFVKVNDANDSKKEEDAEALASKVSFTDAKVVGKILSGQGFMKSQYKPGGEPGIKKTKFYLDEKKEKFAGRKVYLAGRINNIKSFLKLNNDPGKKYTDYKDFFALNNGKKEKGTDELFIFPNTEYEFYIHFSSLTEQELADVICLIELEENRYHALGKGKNLGLGRVQMKVEGIHYRNREYLLNFEQEIVYKEELKKQLLPKAIYCKEKKYNKFLEYLNSEQFDNEKKYSTNNQKAYPYRELNEDLSLKSKENKDYKSNKEKHSNNKISKEKNKKGNNQKSKGNENFSISEKIGFDLKKKFYEK